MSVLIITGLDDVHADRVIPKLERPNQRNEVIRLNTDNLTENLEFKMESPLWDGQLHIRDSQRTVRLRDVSSIWYRKPVPIVTKQRLSFEPANSFVNEEYTALLRSIFGLLAERFWVSDYWSIRKASQKLPNLDLASRLGLQTPRTLVTNDEKEARRFAEECSWRVLAKPFALTTFKVSPEAKESWDSFSTIFDETTFEKLGHSISLAPVMLQEYVDKDIELRVTVVGNQLFCTAIDFQRHEFAIHDWRAVDVEELGHEPYDLPASLKERLFEFNRCRGLQFSTFDIIVDPKGRFVWLEANPNGQWLWLEELTGQPISDAIACLLVDPQKFALRIAR